MRSRQTSNAKYKFALIIGVTALALLSWRFFPTPGEFVAETIFSPLLKGEMALYRATGGGEAALTDQERTEIDYLRAENASLREVMGTDGEDRVAAGVIGRPSALPYDVLLIDQGSDNGIKEGAPVYVNEDTVIGFVAATYSDSALVALLSTPSFTSTAYILGPNIYTTAVGIGGGVTRIHVPQGIELKTGDLVVLPSLSKGIYGRISAVDSVPERAEQYGYMTTDVPINSLRLVSVGTTPLRGLSFEEARAEVEGAKREFLMVDVPEGVLVDVGSASSTATSTDDVATSTEENDL